MHMRGEGSIATVKIACLLDVDVRGLCLVAFEDPPLPEGRTAATHRELRLHSHSRILRGMMGEGVNAPSP